MTFQKHLDGSRSYIEDKEQEITLEVLAASELHHSTYKFTIKGQEFKIFVNNSYPKNQKIWTIHTIQCPQEACIDKVKIEQALSEAFEAFKTLCFPNTASLISIVFEFQGDDGHLQYLDANHFFPNKKNTVEKTGSP